MTVEKKKNIVESKRKTQKKRVERVLQKRGSLLIENTKKLLVLKGNKTCLNILEVLRDISKLVKPHSKSLSHKNEVLPFEDINSIEFLSQKNDCSLFAFGSHSKKRPNNLILGRHFDWHVLDMVEFGVDNFQSIQSIGERSKAVGSKPAFLFLGDQWEQDSNYSRIMNLLVDIFRGDKIEKLSLKGLDNVIVCCVNDGKIYIRPHTISFKKGNGRIPVVDLNPMGPFLDLTVRRFQFAQEDMWKAACRTPKGLTAVTKKNVSKNKLGDKVGRVHLKKQNLDQMGGRRVNALRDH